MVKRGWSNDALAEDPSLAESDNERALYNEQQERECNERERDYQLQRDRHHNPDARWLRHAIRLNHGY